MKPILANALVRRLGRERVSIAPDDLDRHALDARRAFRGFLSLTRVRHRPLAVVYPSTARHVAETVRLCREHRAPLIAFGGGSGLMGSASGCADGVTVDFTRMNRLLDLDVESQIVLVQPGLTWARLNEELAPHGLESGHDPWTVSIATIGGAVALNGLGYLAGRYGSAADQVLGLSAVAADGSVFRIRPARKRSVGPDLPRLLTGSEGTLALVTEFSLAVHPIPELRRPALYEFTTFEGGFRCLLRLFSQGLAPTSLDLGVEDWPGPGDHATPTSGVHTARLLLVYDGHTEVVEAHHRRAARLIADSGGRPLPDSEAQAEWGNRHAVAEMWRADPAVRDGEWLRFRAPGAPAESNAPLLFDYVHACLPPSHLLPYRKSTHDVARRCGLRIVQDGVWIRPDLYSAAYLAWGKDGPRRLARARRDLARAAHAAGGSMEYVHGVGVHLKPFLKKEWGSAWNLMRKIKRALDPEGLLNPGKLF
ncbi:MAG: FAD-binding oxidoreductase [Nitrospirae bacterium]|nr:FAD-binding oxidoreductase [Nitrospirota bacterium]